MASLGAGVQPRSTVQLFMPVSGVEKPPFSQFFSRLWGVISRGKAFRDQQCQFLKKTRPWAAKTNQTVRWLLSACVPVRFCPEAPASSTVDVNSRFSRFQISAIWSNGLASSVFIFAPILLRFFFFIVFVYARATICCYRFFNFDLRKKLCFVKADQVG